jgi:bacteriocin-like protein
MKPEDVKKEQELNEEELDNVSGGAAPDITQETKPKLTPA